MEILIIGGTVFLGRALVDAARDKGHALTLFNRGKSNPDLFPDVTRIHGDRKTDLDRLDGTWDAVIDTCGYFPLHVRDSANHLADRTKHYTFVSSISVYESFATPNDESSPVAVRDDVEDVTEVTGDSYGPLKAACEAAAEAAMPGRVLNVRPGLIVGPHDGSERFAYWPRRFARGGEVLAPGTPDRPVRFIDVRDLAEWMVRAADGGIAGVVNADGPVAPLSMGAFLEACAAAGGTDAAITWVDEDFLIDNGAEPWTGLPLWLPSEGDFAAFNDTDCSKAYAAGLTTRPAIETIRDTLAWDASRDAIPASHLLDPETEAQLLAAWAAR